MYKVLGLLALAAPGLASMRDYLPTKYLAEPAVPWLDTLLQTRDNSNGQANSNGNGNKGQHNGNNKGNTTDTSTTGNTTHTGRYLNDQTRRELLNSSL